MAEGKAAAAAERLPLAQVAMELHLPPAKVFSLCTRGDLDAVQDARGVWQVTVTSMRKFKHAQRAAERATHKAAAARTRGVRKHGK